MDIKGMQFYLAPEFEFHMIKKSVLDALITANFLVSNQMQIKLLRIF